MSTGAFIPPPTICEPLRDIVKRFGGGIADAGNAAVGEYPVTYPPPLHTTNELRTFLNGFAHANRKSAFIARLVGGRVFGSGIVLSPDGRSIARDVSSDFGKPAEQHWLLGYSRMKPPQRIAGATAVISVTLGHGYGHWLLEELPRLLLLGRSNTPADTILLHRERPFIEEALSLLAPPRELVATKRYSHFECDELIVPGLIGGEGCPSPHSVRLLRDFALPMVEGPEGSAMPGAERLYVTRESAGRRRVVNEVEVKQLLENRGFIPVRLEELTWGQQVSLFARARIIVAPHGAGLANLAFCQPQTRVIELFGRDYVNPCYWRLAGVADLDYHPLIEPGATALSYDLKAKQRHLTVDINALTRALDAI